MKNRSKERVDMGNEMGKEGRSWRVCTIESISWILNDQNTRTKRRRDKTLVGPRPAETGFCSQLGQNLSMKEYSLADGRKLRTPHACLALEGYLLRSFTYMSSLIMKMRALPINLRAFGPQGSASTGDGASKIFSSSPPLVTLTLGAGTGEACGECTGS